MERDKKTVALRIYQLLHPGDCHAIGGRGVVRVGGNSPLGGTQEYRLPAVALEETR